MEGHAVDNHRQQGELGLQAAPGLEYLQELLLGPTDGHVGGGQPVSGREDHTQWGGLKGPSLASGAVSALLLL